MTLLEINELVEKTKDLDTQEQRKIAYKLNFIECAIYVKIMKEKYNKQIYI
ncbi:hypothetical protein M0Q50_08600 [bacterium]|jgi:hypothetical protein|nr:hypothetical protein [bacterium]